MVKAQATHLPSNQKVHPSLRLAREITESTHAPGGVAAFMSAHSTTPYITRSMDFSSGDWVARGGGGQQLVFDMPIIII